MNQAARDIDPRRSQFAFWDPSLRAVGRSFRSVAYGQVENGLLRSGDVKLLILPFSQAISAREADEIRDFVSRGGCVMACAAFCAAFCAANCGHAARGVVRRC